MFNKILTYVKKLIFSFLVFRVANSRSFKSKINSFDTVAFNFWDNLDKKDRPKFDLYLNSVVKDDITLIPKYNTMTARQKSLAVNVLLLRSSSSLYKSYLLYTLFEN